MPPAIAAAISTSVSPGGPLLVLGCELTPMPKTQRALVATLRLLLEATVEEGEGTALLTVDACALQLSSPPSSAAMEYPRLCPLAAVAAEGRAPCAGHRFLALAEAAEGGMDWSVERIWTAEEARAACRARRVRREQEEEEEEDFCAATAPEGLVLVALTRRRT